MSSAILMDRRRIACDFGFVFIMITDVHRPLDGIVRECIDSCDYGMNALHVRTIVLVVAYFLVGPYLIPQAPAGIREGAAVEQPAPVEAVKRFIMRLVCQDVEGGHVDVILIFTPDAEGAHGDEPEVERESAPQARPLSGLF